MAAIVDAGRKVLNNYANFKGRASRPEFWWWVLLGILAQAVTQVIDLAIFGAPDEMGGGQPISVILSLAILLPSIAVGARRLHDMGKSGWWLLIGLIPILGFFVLLYFYVQPSDPDSNDFGPPDPLTA